MRRVEATDHYAGPSMTEAQLKERVLTLAHAAGWRIYHRPARYQRNGGGSGYPDLTLARHGQVIWIELKADKGVMSDAQVAWSDALGEARCHVIRSEDIESGRIGRLLANGTLG